MGNVGVKVARHSGGPEIAGPNAENSLDAEDRQLVEGYVRNYMPGISQTMVAHAKCYYTTTPDEHFVIDRVPSKPQVTVVAGLSGHGFKFTSVLGEIASELVMEKQIELDIELFAFSRF
jgi:glycine/D-amino acid oxidase-like deaminating enzyme